ncbi:BNR-4 repeat-containing protein [Bdellovibrio bacteriovorus]
MKKLTLIALGLTALVVTVKTVSSKTPGASSFSSNQDLRVYAPIKLPAFSTESLTGIKTSQDALKLIADSHERAVFGWNPAFPVYIPAFDSSNTPYLRKHLRSQLTDLENGFVKFDGSQWLDVPLDASALQVEFSDTPLEDLKRANRQDILWDPKMAVFDKNDILYTALRVKDKNPFLRHYALMYSRDGGATWKSKKLLSSDNLPQWYDLERPYSHAPLQGPPAFIYYKIVAKVPGYEKGFQDWQGTFGELVLQTSHFNKQGDLVLDKPITISHTAQPIGYRSGSAVKILRSGNKYFVVWLEATLNHPLEKNEQGRPTNIVPDKDGSPYSGIWVAEYDLVKKSLSKKEILRTWPVNDSHNQPGIVRTSQGHLHVVGGSHGGHFTYTSSVKTDSIVEWTPEQFVNLTDSGYAAAYNIPGVPGGSQTYVSLIVDSKDQLHLAYRLWTQDRAIHDKEYFGALAYQTAQVADGKNTGWSTPKILVYPNAHDYSHYYQVLAIDRRDTLYLEYSQLRPWTPYFMKFANQEVFNTSPMQNSAILKSTDQGKSWYLVDHF